MSGNEREQRRRDFAWWDKRVMVAVKITEWKREWQRAKEYYRGGNEAQRHDQGAGRLLAAVDANAPGSRVESDMAKDVGRRQGKV